MMSGCTDIRFGNRIILVVQCVMSDVYLTHYSPVLLFYIYPLKTLENIRKLLGFLMFLGGIEKQHRAVMG